MQFFPESLLDSFPFMRFVTDCGPVHTHRFWEMAVFLNGKAYNNETDGKRVKCPPLYCTIFRPNIDCHFVEHSSASEFAHVDIYISNKKMRNICDMIKTDDGTPFIDVLLNSKTIPQFFLSQQTVTLIQASLNKQDFWPQTTDRDNLHSSIIFLILSEYYSSLKNNQLEQSDVVNRVINLLKEPSNFTKRLDEILKPLPFSRTYINQEFKKQTNSTLVSYFFLTRIKPY